MKSNTLLYAERELNVLSKTVKEPIIAPFYNEILALCDKFGKSGQSGGSAPSVANALAQTIKKLCLQEPILEITGIADEWVDVAQITELVGNYEDVFQNNREGCVFKQGMEGKPYYLDAISWKLPNGICLYGSAKIPETGEIISSRQYIKKFPFKPKTFYISVAEKEIVAGEIELHILNPAQLKSVFKYYEKYSNDIR